MKAFSRDGYVGVQAETKEEMELLQELHRQAARGNAFINGCNDPEGGFNVSLTVEPKPTFIQP
jgi:hypothetical protein